MARETGYNEDTVKHLVNRLETVHNVIRYSKNTKELLLLNWWKYNWTESDKLRKGVKSSAEVVKSVEFRKYIDSVLEGDIPPIYPMDTVSIPSQYPVHTSVTVTDSVTDTDTETVSDSKSKSYKTNHFGEVTADCRQETEEYSPGFESFWQEYPRKVGKREAYRAFRKVREPLAVLLDAVREQKQSEMWTKENGRFIPNPATWLNQGRWEDRLAQREVMPF